VHCWRPSGSLKEELQSFFLGTSTCLVDEDIIFGKAWEKRSQLMTVSSGTVSSFLDSFLHSKTVDNDDETTPVFILLALI
jgi:hypothetical protein